MESVKIYLSGAMSGSTLEVQNKWRKNVINAIKYGDYYYEKKPIFFNPVDFYNTEEMNYKTEKEVMEFDLHNLRSSDLVIVNFNNLWSIGTAMELAIAKEYRIPVIAFNANNKEIHPWLKECCSRICDDMKEAVSYAVDYYLN